MKNSVKLLLAMSAVTVKVQAAAPSAASPTRLTLDSSSNAQFPRYTKKIELSNASTHWTSNASNEFLAAAGATTTAYMYEKAIKNKNGAGIASGLYAAFRIDKMAVYPSQNISKGATAKANCSVTNMATGYGPTLYGTKYDSTKHPTFASYQAAPTAATANSWTDTEIKNAQSDGATWGACPEDALDKTNNKAPIGCKGLVEWQHKGDATGANAANLEFNPVIGRLFWTSTTNGGNAGALKTWDIGVDAATANNDKRGTTNAATTVLATAQTWDADLILASFYQSNGTATDSTTWCDGIAAGKIMTSGTNTTPDTTKSLKAIAGIGPKTKCTWQIQSTTGTSAPSVGLKDTPVTFAQLQIIEFYDISHFGANQVIGTATNAGTSPMSSDATAYATTNGVFLNPFTKAAATNSGISDATIEWAPDYLLQGSAIKNEAGSIGTALYYDRSKGQSENTIRSVDSLWVTRAYEGYNGAVTTYNGLKTTYDTKKKEYEDAVEARTKDPKTTVPTRPDMPSGPGAYSGPQMVLAGQQGTPTTTWADMKKQTTYNLVLANTGKSSDSSQAYDNSKIKTNQFNRYSYLSMTVDSTGDRTKTTGVAHSFGRLGQSQDQYPAATASPFYWATAVAGSKPTLQVSLLPEVGGAAASMWDDWAVTQTFTLEWSVNPLATMSSFDAPSPPTAATAITVGAQALAASLVAAATVATTLF